MSAEPSWLEPIKSFSCICANSIGTNCWLSLSGLGCKDGCTYLQGRMHVPARTDAVHCRGGCSALRERLQCTASEMGKTEEPILWRTALQAEVFVELYPRALPPVTHSSALQAPERMWSIIRGRILSRGQVFISVYRLAIDAEPERVMMWLAENIQACLRIFRRAQHQWLVRDILHQAQGVFIVFVLWHR